MIRSQAQSLNMLDGLSDKLNQHLDEGDKNLALMKKYAAATKAGSTTSAYFPPDAPSTTPMPTESTKSKDPGFYDAFQQFKAMAKDLGMTDEEINEIDTKGKFDAALDNFKTTGDSYSSTQASAAIRLQVLMGAYSNSVTQTTNVAKTIHDSLAGILANMRS